MTSLDVMIDVAEKAKARYMAAQAESQQAFLQERPPGEIWELELKVRTLFMQAMDAQDRIGSFVMVNRDKIRYEETEVVSAD